MIDIENLRKNPEIFRQSMRNRNYDPKIVDDFLTADKKWRELLIETETKRSEQKKLGAQKKIEEAKAIKIKLEKLNENLKEITQKRAKFLRQIPNLILEGVPIGKDESDNVVLHEEGKKPEFSFKPKDYVALSENLGIIDTERAAKVSGSRFGYILGGLAQLEFALFQFAIDVLTNEKILKRIIAKNKLKVRAAPFTFVIPPVMVKKEMMEAMGYVERGGAEIYFLDKEKLYLVGTSEQSIGPMHSGEVLAEKDLPRRYLSFSTCFRREAGSYGKDTKGILRVHQFNKLEMFSINTPHFSRDEHQFLLAIEEYLMQSLELPYRILNICSGDLGDPAAAKYDIEVWLPGQLDGKGEYRETHSTSNTTDFQSRRLNIKYNELRTGNLKLETKFVHLLNGTAFSERPLLAILENYQTEKGTIKVPKVLQKYCGLKEIA